MSSSPRFINCVIAENRISVSSACRESDICINDARGNDVYCENSSATFVNCTVSTDVSGKAVYVGRGGNVTFVNCIIWGESAGVVYPSDGAAAPLISLSCVKAGPVWPGPGNLNENPLLTGFRPDRYSPVVNAGTLYQ